MSATYSFDSRSKSRSHRKQDGLAAVEFALVVLPFLMLMFGIIELARLLYVFNTLPEVTRSAARAATNISFLDDGRLNAARARAVFNERTGTLPFGHPIAAEHIRIEYLYLGPQGTGQELQIIPEGSMPASPAQNRINCMTNPNGINCIRAVQVRVCLEGTAAGPCTRIPYETLMPLVRLPVSLPTALTIVNAETLGYVAGDAPGP